LPGAATQRVDADLTDQGVDTADAVVAGQPIESVVQAVADHTTERR
jgi:hypothetical protein